LGKIEGVLKVCENGRVRDVALGDSTTIGRASDSDVQILDLRSSKTHCTIVRKDGSFVLIDAGSTNGTRVNGERVERVVLRPADVIEIGEVRITYEGDAPDETEPETAPSRPSRRSRAGSKERADAPVRSPLVTELRELVRRIAEELGLEGLLAADAVFREELPSAREGGSAGALASTNLKLRRILAGNAQLLAEHSLKRLLEQILDSAVEITGAERGFIVLRDESDSRSSIAAARNIDRESLRRPEEKISHSVAEQVLDSGVGMVSTNASDDPRFESSMSVTDLKLRSILCAPIAMAAGRKAPERVLGVIYVDNRFGEGVFTEDDLMHLGALAQQAALALENARLIERERKTSALLNDSKQKLEHLNAVLEAKVDRQEHELVELRSAKPRTAELKYDYSEIIGASAAMQRVFETLDKVIDSDVPVLIQGASGTGKELVARAIHYNGPRSERPFVTENCAAISETLLESELFGHVRGAFTDAHSDKLGLFEVADGGTLFLDEIGDMSPGMQKKLLRALQEGEIRRVGGKKSIHVDVRVIAASNKLLREMIQRGEFRDARTSRRWSSTSSASSPVRGVASVASPGMRSRCSRAMTGRETSASSRTRSVAPARSPMRSSTSTPSRPSSAAGCPARERRLPRASPRPPRFPLASGSRSWSRRRPRSSSAGSSRKCSPRPAGRRPTRSSVCRSPARPWMPRSSSTTCGHLSPERTTSSDQPARGRGRAGRQARPPAEVRGRMRPLQPTACRAAHRCRSGDGQRGASACRCPDPSW
jgi:transcriptional regulator with GAF, ATPase, and Fis domain/pSer/pThr/pTyr-binding forkhead associated (FHA) protein